MAFQTTGNTISVTAGTTENNLNGANIGTDTVDALKNGTILAVNGELIDHTGGFNLILTGNSFFGSSGSGKIEIGKRVVTGGKINYSKGGVLTVKNNGLANQGHINYVLGDASGRSNSGEFSLYNTTLTHYTSTSAGRSNAFISNLGGSIVNVVNQNSSPANILNLRFQNGANVDDNVIQNVKQFEFQGNPESFKRNKLIDTYGFINYATGALIKLDNIDFIGQLANVGLTFDGGLYYIDTYRDGTDIQESEINTLPTDSYANIGIRSNSNPNLHGIQWGKSQRETLQLADGTKTKDKVYFKNKDNVIVTSVVTEGTYSQTIKLKRATNTGVGVPTYENYYPITKAIVGYDTEISVEVYANYDQFVSLGLSGNSVNIRKPDKNISATKEEIDNLTHISTTKELYSAAKLLLDRNYAFESAPYFSINGDDINLNDYNLVVSTSVTEVIKKTSDDTFTVKVANNGKITGNITTTGLVTNTNYVDGIIIDAAQDSVINLKGAVSWTESTTNGSGSGPFKYKFVANTTYRFTLSMSSGIVYTIDPITPTEAGITEVDISEQGTLINIDKRLDVLEDILAHARAANTQTQPKP